MWRRIGGLFLGYLICVLQINFHFLKLSGGDDSSFVIDYYPVEFRAWDPVITMGIIIGISFTCRIFSFKKSGGK